MRAVGSIAWTMMLAVWGAGCSSSSGDAAPGGDVGSDTSSADTGAPIDAAKPTLTIDPPKALVLVDTTPSVPKPATQTFTAVLHGDTGDVDVTSEVALSVTNPTLGTFSGNTFTSEIAPKDRIWGATDTVNGSARGAYGTATLTVAWLKMTGDQRVMFFQAPTGAPPAPAHDVMAQVVPSGGPYDIGYLTLNDPRNPPQDGGTTPIDAQPLLGKVRAMAEGDASQGCTPQTTQDTDADGIDDTFIGVPGDAKICFDITPAPNDTLTKSMFLDAYIDVVEKPSDHILQLRTVLFFVPP